MEAPGSPSSSTSGSYVIAETAGIDDHGEVFTGQRSNRATQSSSSRKEAASGPVQGSVSRAEPIHASRAPSTSSPHQEICVRSDGNIVVSAPGHEGEAGADDNSAAQSAEPQPEGFQDYDEELDYMDVDANPGSGHAGRESHDVPGHDVVMPPPLAYIQEAAGTPSTASPNTTTYWEL